MVDRLDRKILQILQEDATVPVAEIGRRVGLSTTPCWRRIQKLEEEGVIKRRVAVLDPARINARVNVFVSIRTSSHSHEWLRRFSEVVQEFPEVVEFYRMSGEVDYLMKVVTRDVEGYERFLKASEAIFKVGFEELGDVPFDSWRDMARIVPAMLTKVSCWLPFGILPASSVIGTFFWPWGDSASSQSRAA